VPGRHITSAGRAIAADLSVSVKTQPGAVAIVEAGSGDYRLEVV
jgi:hypothetical protein